MDRVIIGLDRVTRWIGKEMTSSSTIQIMVHSIVLPYANLVKYNFTIFTEVLTTLVYYKVSF